TVWRNGKIYEQDYIRGLPQHSVTSKANDSKIPHGTQIVLKPDSSIFGEREFCKEKINKWLCENYSGVMDKVKIN
ncbi:MAG: hypothetical protein K6A89_04130, partial [Treponema sp.]|nr:hypothetical protein [Treponema sp.]